MPTRPDVAAKRARAKEAQRRDDARATNLRMQAMQLEQQADNISSWIGKLEHERAKLLADAAAARVAAAADNEKRS